MANVLTAGALLSAPTKQPSLLARILRPYAGSKRHPATRAVEQYVAEHGMRRLSDNAARQISRLSVKAEM